MLRYIPRFVWYNEGCSGTLSAVVKAPYFCTGMVHKVSIVASDEVMVFHARVFEPDHSYACSLCFYPILNKYYHGA